MFWNDIEEIKVSINSIETKINTLIELNLITKNNIDISVFREAVEQALCSAAEYNSINMIHEKLNLLVYDKDKIKAMDLATQTLDKIDDYMKNVDKLNSLINEFKGCVSIARASLELKKDHDIITKELCDKMLKIAKFVEKHEKKTKKPRKSKVCSSP